MSHNESRIARLLRWRKKNAALYAKKWSEAVARSEKIKEAARKVAAAYKEKARATKRQMPQFQKGEAHVRAIIWRLRSPSNRKYEFKNLAEFLRQHSDLFAPDDVRWHRVKTAETCRAYKGLAALRPYLADGAPRRRVEGSWKGWRWVASEAVEAMP